VVRVARQPADPARAVARAVRLARSAQGARRAVELPPQAAQLIRYATSGDVTGDRGEVVGYAAITVM
jgi:AmmeMemoRadiSam system protein B